MKRWDRLASVSKVGIRTGSLAAVRGIPCVLDKGEGVSVVLSLPVGHLDVALRGLDRWNVVLILESRVDELVLCSGIRECSWLDTVDVDLVGDVDVGKVGHTYRVIVHQVAFVDPRNIKVSRVANVGFSPR